MWSDEIRAKCRLEYDICDEEDHSEIISRSVIEEEDVGWREENDLMESAMWESIQRYCQNYPPRIFHFIIKILNLNLEYSGYDKIKEYEIAMESFFKIYETLNKKKKIN